MATNRFFTANLGWVLASRSERVFHSLPRGVNSGGHGDASERKRRRKKKTLTGRRNLAKLDSVRRDLDPKGREARL